MKTFSERCEARKRAIKDELKRKYENAPNIDTKDHESTEGFTVGGLDLRGFLPIVQDRAHAMAMNAARDKSLTSECWSLAFRLAASELDRLRDKKARV